VTVDEIATLFDSYDRFRNDRLRPGNCRHAELIATLEALGRSDGRPVTVTNVGFSLERRPIQEVRFGEGPTRVLLWSQMHGDEPTATLALCDLFTFLVRCHPAPAWLEIILQRLTVSVIPMLNPDGAERPHRCTAALIDMNRDAVALRTPEARILRDVHKNLRPSFAFNLHDQSVSSVGRSRAVAAMALLAPPPDETRTITPNRLCAMKLGAVIARALYPFAEGHLATYDDVYEPRAFGDLFQAMGTPTLLIESGQWPGDPDKEHVRCLNFTGLLCALSAIAEGTVDSADLADYTSLPVNGRMMVDLIVHNVRLQATNGWSEVVGMALMRERARGGVLVLKEVGDVGLYGALRTLDAGGAMVPAERLKIDEPLDESVLRGLS
jgi:hypothetical protein